MSRLTPPSLRREGSEAPGEQPNRPLQPLQPGYIGRYICMAASRHLAAKSSGDRGHGERLAIVTRRRQESPSRRLFLEESTSNLHGSSPCGSASTPAPSGLRRWWDGGPSAGLEVVLRGHRGCSRWEVMLLSLKHNPGVPHPLGIPSPTAAPRSLLSLPRTSVSKAGSEAGAATAPPRPHCPPPALRSGAPPVPPVPLLLP